MGGGNAPLTPIPLIFTYFLLFCWIFDSSEHKSNTFLTWKDFFKHKHHIESLFLNNEKLVCLFLDNHELTQLFADADHIYFGDDLITFRFNRLTKQWIRFENVEWDEFTGHPHCYVPRRWAKGTCLGLCAVEPFI